MKYVAIIDSDDELSEDVIKCLVKDTVFMGDETAPYCFDITSIKPAPEKAKSDSFWGNFHYNQALKDCGVIEDDRG